jgi:hypothetical protein
MVVLFVIFAPLDGVSDRIATGQGVGAPGIDNTTGRRGDEVDTRLVLQIGMLLALLYVAFVCMWLSRTRGGWAPGDVIHRLRSRWSEALADAWARLVGRPRAGVALEGPSVCSIAWKPGHHRSRFQAVISTPGGRRVVAESDSLPWPPKDARNPPTREIEAALASLVAKVVAEGWEPVQSDGPWTERRFVSRSTNLVALDVGGSVALPVERRVVPRGLPLPLVALLVGSAALGGLALAKTVESGGRAPASRAAPATQTLVHEGLRVRLPSGWTRAAATPVAGFKRPLGLRNARKRVSAIVERLPATSATLLPAAFQPAAAAAARPPEVVRLAPGQSGWRYRFPSSNGSSTIVLTAPTTAGVTTVACTSPPGAGMPQGCAALASAVTVPGSRPLQPGGSAAFFSRLPGAMGALERERVAGMRQLSAAGRARGQAAAATGLARAHAATARSLAPLASPGAALPARTVAALTATSAAYATLASTARAGSAPGYAMAVRAVHTTDANLRRALTAVAASANAVSSIPDPAVPARRGGTDPSLPALGLAGVLAALLVVRRVRRG